MKTQLMQEVLQKAPFGYAFHQFVFNEKGEAVDFIFLDINPAFEELTGLTKESILGRKATEVIPNIRQGGFDWVSCYAMLALNGEKMQFNQYSQPLGRWFKTTAFVPEEGYFITVFEDITAEIRRMSAVQQEKDWLRITLESINYGVITTDPNGNVTVLNKAAKEICGWRMEDVFNKPFDHMCKLLHEDTGQEMDNLVKKSLQTGETVTFSDRIVLVAGDGNTIPVAGSAAAIKDKEGRILGAVLTFRNVSKEREKQGKILYLSYHDSLTGLYNRRYVEEYIEKMNLPDKAPWAILMGDVNGLKLTNDLFGHDSGDTLLKEITRVLQECCRKDDIIARWGGDEFVILLPQANANTAEEIIGRIEKRCILNRKGHINLSMSLGCSIYDSGGRDIWQVLKEAEENMYRNKLLNAKKNLSAVVASLKATLYEKCIESEECLLRKNEITRRLATRLGLSRKQSDDLALLAEIHDIGLMVINEDYLRKAGPLTEEEWEEIKKHPEIGCRIAQSTPELSDIAEYILCHHERWDGKGYPRGIRGNEIPLVSRIFAVIDAFIAMTSVRAYRRAKEVQEALAELRMNAGSQFDSRIVHTFANECIEQKKDTKQCELFFGTETDAEQENKAASH